MIKELFSKNGIKITSQRELVINAVNELKVPATVQEINKYCCDKVNLSTIYRIVQLLTDKKIFAKNLTNNGDLYYTFNSSNHVHYINCIKCNLREEIEYCPFKDIEKNINNGYILLSHSFGIDGICSKCSN